MTLFIQKSTSVLEWYVKILDPALMGSVRGPVCVLQGTQDHIVKLVGSSCRRVGGLQ